MSFKIVRHDITKMHTEAIVNTANPMAAVGSGCDRAIYEAAGFDALLAYRKKYIGEVKEGSVFITPGFNLAAKYIIHAVSPLFIDGKQGEEKKLRSCYRESLALAKKEGISSIAFPLIATGGFGYPKEEGMRIAADEINGFLLHNDMEVFLVVFDAEATMLGEKLYPKLEAYIDHHYVKTAKEAEYDEAFFGSGRPVTPGDDAYRVQRQRMNRCLMNSIEMKPSVPKAPGMPMGRKSDVLQSEVLDEEAAFYALRAKLNERIAHRADTFSEYLLYLIASKGMKNSEVYNRAIVDKRYFSKIKNNKNFHPEKIKALCLCVGARLNLDETRDLLARAGYALSPSDLTDIIFSFYIENEHYDVVDIDIQLEEHGLPCIIS